MDGTKLGKRIKQLRIDHDLKQEDLANLFGFSNYQQVSKWEAGKLFPSIEQIAVLSTTLKYNLFHMLAQMFEDGGTQTSSDGAGKTVPHPLQDQGERMSRFEESPSGGKSKVRDHHAAQGSTRSKGK